MSDEQATIHELMPKVMADIGAIGKGERNTQQNYSFRGIDTGTEHTTELFVPGHRHRDERGSQLAHEARRVLHT
jgi:hypothetical protein